MVTVERKLADVRVPLAVIVVLVLGCCSLATAQPGGGPAGAHAGPGPGSTVELDSPARQSLRDSQLRTLPAVLAALADLDVAARSFVQPVEGRVSSNFGWRNIAVNGNRHHAGIDLAASWGTPVRAARDGMVGRSGWWGTYGNAVALDHGDGSETRYAHLSSVAVEAGDVVRQGDVIGYVGSTGASTGPHLHFELRFDGRAVDPLGYLVERGVSATR